MRGKGHQDLRNGTGEAHAESLEETVLCRENTCAEVLTLFKASVAPVIQDGAERSQKLCSCHHTGYGARNMGLIPGEWAGKEAQGERETRGSCVSPRPEITEAWIGRWCYK